MEKSSMKQHVTFVGALHIGFGILGLIGAVALYLSFNFALGFVEHEPIAVTVLETLRIALPLLILFFSVMDIVGGIGLFSYTIWGRILVLILSAINCFNIPFGTASGVYSIWVLMNKEVIELFEKKNA
jgi:hypothetical protein